MEQAKGERLILNKTKVPLLNVLKHNDVIYILAK